MKRFVVASVSMLMACGGASPVMAQYAPITVSRNISFGSNVTATTTIAYTASGAAAFVVQFPNYSQTASVSFTFVLPSYLTDVAGNHLPISFAANSAAYHVNVNSTNGATTFNPSNGLTGTLGLAAHPDYFWLGATVTPGTNFIASDYSGEVTVSVNVTVGTQHYVSTATITVTATLLGRVSLSVSGALDFGLVVAGTTPPSLSAMAGTAPQIVVTGVRSRSTVSFSSSTSLGDLYGNALTFTPSLYGSPTNNQSGAQVVTSGSTISPNRRSNLYYLWLGGALDPVPAGQPSGNYTGYFVLTVVY